MTDIKFFHRIKLPDGTYTPGSCNHGPDGGDWPTTRFGMPEDLTGKTVIDIGCYDGFFSFEAEKRNAKRVISTDREFQPGFMFCKKELSSKVDPFKLDMDMPTNMGWPQYDLVLCYGVLYHLKAPLIAMENLFELTKSGGVCLIETAIVREDDEPKLVYRQGWAGDNTNYFYPNELFILEAASKVGFSGCDKIFDYVNRSTFRLYK